MTDAGRCLDLASLPPIKPPVASSPDPNILATYSALIVYFSFDLLAANWAVLAAQHQTHNKLRNLSLSGIGKYSQTFSIGLCINHHYQYTLYKSSLSSSFHHFDRVLIFRLEDGDRGVAVSRGLSPSLFDQAAC